MAVKPSPARALSLIALAAVLAAGAGLPPTRAEAQGLFGNWDDAPPKAKLQKVKRRAEPAVIDRNSFSSKSMTWCG